MPHLTSDTNNSPDPLILFTPPPDTASGDYFEMGCCMSKVPDAETFLVNHMEGQLAPEDHLLPGLPTKLEMDDWETVWKSHATSGWAVPSNEGVGNEETLAVSDADGNVVAKLNMPRYRSFGVGATMTDAAGNVAAWLKSPHTHKQRPIDGPSYCIFGAKPVVMGQKPTGPNGSYLRETVKMPSFGFGCKVLSPSGEEIYSMKWYGTGGTVVPFSVQLPGKKGPPQGVMVSGVTNHVPKRHDIQVAEGADVALSICIMYAFHLIDSETEKS